MSLRRCDGFAFFASSRFNHAGGRAGADVGVYSAAEGPVAQHTVLLVDDDPVFVNALTAVLSTRYRVRTAADGEEALASLLEERPDLIVLDVMLTYPSEGYDLAATLKKNPETSDIPIVILTGVSRVFEVRARLEQSWVDVESFHTKPPDFGKLLETIERHLAKAPVA
jgi:CheY-like chemotaxis protein